MPLLDAPKPPGPAGAYDGARDLLEWLGEQIERHGDLVRAQAFGGEIFIVNHPDHVQHILRKNWRNYRKGLAIKKVAMLTGPGLMVSEGGPWISQRKKIQPAFHHRVVETMTCMMRSDSLALRDAWLDQARRGRPINVTRDISHAVLTTVLRSLFGDDFDRAEPHFRILSEEDSRDLEFAQAFRPLRAVVADIMAHRRSAGITPPDLLGLLMETRTADGGPAMTDAQLITEIMTLVVAGHETTATTLNWAWCLISQNPIAEAALHRELDAGSDLSGLTYTRQVVEETMRLYPAGWLLTRRAIKDDRLGPYVIPARSELYISPYYLQRHPAFWPDPHRFDPERFDPARAGDRPELAMLAFSAGPRNCIGEQYARLKMQIHLATIGRVLSLRFNGDSHPALDAGVNLRSRSDIMMTGTARELRP